MFFSRLKFIFPTIEKRKVKKAERMWRGFRPHFENLELKFHR